MENENLDIFTESDVDKTVSASGGLPEGGEVVLEVETAAPETAEPAEPEIEAVVPEGDAAQSGETSPEGLEETVSSGDAIVGSENVSGVPEGVYPTAEDIAAALSLSGTEVIVVQEYTLLGENAKPVEQYSVTEGLLLIIVLVLVGHVISKVIGGALSCKYLFRK